MKNKKVTKQHIQYAKEMLSELLDKENEPFDYTLYLNAIKAGTFNIIKVYKLIEDIKNDGYYTGGFYQQDDLYSNILLFSMLLRIAGRQENHDIPIVSKNDIHQGNNEYKTMILWAVFGEKGAQLVAEEDDKYASYNAIYMKCYVKTCNNMLDVLYKYISLKIEDKHDFNDPVVLNNTLKNILVRLDRLESKKCCCDVE